MKRESWPSGLNNKNLKRLEGIKFGRLLVVSFSHMQKSKHCWFSIWNCICDCGGSCKAIGKYLMCGDKKSCGCLQPETASNLFKKHGQSQTHPLYEMWKGMRARCNNKNHISYKYYGGRGIKVCERWNDFALFVQDMFPSWKEGLTIERVGNNGNYEPGNCIWETQKIQANNTRKNVFITVGGETRTMSGWDNVFGVCYHTIASRIALGWSSELAVTKPVMPHKPLNR